MRLKRSGFSLVLSLTIMAAMVLMVIVLASFLQVESRLAQSHAGYLRARFNALAAAKIAVGQLQQLAGPDQRVTMRADMYANNEVGVGNVDAPTITPSRPNAGNNYTGNNAPAGAKLSHQKRYLTGVWATGGVTSTAVRDWDVTNPDESRLFLGWLSSPFDAGADPEIGGTTPNYVANRTYVLTNGGATGSRRKADMTEGQALIDNLATPIEANPDGILVPLVSYGTVALPTGLTSFQRNYMGAVDARPQPMPGPAFASAGVKLGANGRYAFWIGDEGVKAKVNLPDSYGNNTSGSSLATTPWDQGFSASASMRNSIGSIGGPGAQIKEGVNPKGMLPATFNFDAWRNKDITDTGDAALFQLAKATGLSGLSSWAAKQGGVAAGQAMSDATKILWHDITAYSFSTLTDTYSGGVKTDLSTAFEIPYSMYRGVEVYPGQKESAPFAFTTTSNQHKQSFFHGAPNNTNSGGTDLGLAVDLDYNRPNLLDSLGSANQLLLASPRASEWAPRFTSGLLGTSYSLLKTRNFETPDRMGFVYEAPLRSNLFSNTRDLANTERSNNAAGTNVTRINSYPWPELSSTAIENISGRITRGPTWDLYRNFYRMYKKEIEAASAASSLANRGQAAPSADAVIARGVEPLSYATGNRTAPYNAQWINPVSKPPFAPVTPPDNFYSSGGALTAGKYLYRNNFTGPADAPLFQAEQRLRYPFILPNKYTAVTNFDRLGIAKPTGAADASITPTNQLLTTRPWPTAMSLTPSIVRFSMVFSGVYEGQTASNPGGTIGVTIDPIVVVYNPYDCPIEFEGIAMVTNGQSLPYIFDVKLKNWAFDSSSPQYFTPGAGKFGTEPVPVTSPQTISRTLRVTRDLLLGEVALGEGDYDNRSFSFRVTKGPGQVFRLEPGEVKVLSTPYNVGASYASTRANNTSIRGTEGFDFGSRAVYKMTPFANVRYRQVDVNLQMDTCVPPAQTHDSRMWTWAFTPLSPSTNKPYTDPTTMPNCKFIGDYCTNYADSGLISFSQLATMWGQVTTARDLHDALPQWDGSAKSLKSLIDFYANQGVGSLPNAGVYNSLTFTMRNSGWVNYDGCVVGEESSSYQGVTNSGAPYIFPRKHTGTTNVGGHQVWNFYLLGNKSVDGQQLNADRRWFGAPDYSNNNSLATFKYEGSETAPGINLVDEPLLLSFHALTSGWPMYSNDNAHGSNLIVPNEDWKATRGLTARPPDYRVPTGMAGYSDALAAGTSASISVLGALGGDPEYGYIENTGGRANTLGSRVNGVIKTSPGVIGEKQQFFMSDFALRAADMTSDTGKYKWYPQNQYTHFDGAKNFDAYVATWGGVPLDTLRTPAEMLNAPMTPFFLSVRPQSAHLYAYDGKSHTPLGWVMSQKQLDYGLSTFGNLTLSNDHMNAYWGASVAPASSGSRSDVVLFPVPRRPLLSLSQLGSAGTAQVVTDADFTVGSSFANPGIADLTKITDWPGPKDAVGSSPDDVPVPEHGYVAKTEGTRPVRNYAQVRTDHAFAANLALWDAFFFSGLNMQAPSYSLPAYKSSFPAGPDLPTDATVANQQLASLRKATGNASLSGTSFSEIKDAMNAGYNPLANKRVAYIPDFKAAADATAFPLPTEFPHPTYLARNSLYDGGFNVNSTSKQAWKAVLAGLKGQNLPTDSGSTTTTGTVLSRFARNFMPSSGQSAWNSYRELTDAEIDELAGYVVQEVRDRGPFMSLADFINRRLLSSDHGLKGALQAAIDKSSINNAAITDAGGFFTHPVASVYNDPNGIADTTNYQFRAWDFLLPNKTGSRGLTGSPAPPTPQPRFPSLASMARTGKYASIASRAAVPQDITKPDSGGTHGSDGGAVAGLGAPKIVSQIDVLNSVGANLTARSDTFTVRAYGEALDNAGNTIGKAWVEVIVQRTPFYVVPSSRGPGLEEANRRKLLYRPKTSAEGVAYDNDPIVEMYESVNSAGSLGGLPSDATADEKNAWKVNRLLGRRFKTTNIRWLNANEI